MAAPFVTQIRVGRLRTFTYKDDLGNVLKTFKSPLRKQRIKNKIDLSKTGFTGDDGIDDKDKKEDKAIFAFAESNYEYYRQLLNRSDDGLVIGQMGEHIIIRHVDEFNVFIGDTYQFGEAIIQVSQPRLPCWRTSYNMNDAHLAKDIVESGLTGWHFRVLKTGSVKEKTSLTLIDRPYPEWSVAACNEILHSDKVTWNDMFELSKCDALSEAWKQLLNERLKGKVINYKRRFYGPMNEL